ncbi:hypothetical protein PPYR_06893 [Photinus pyralis]|uniref:Uncharacterized protein n=1 Tax=Photinus pyralis TaxID=7054 RepID=A0A1Y1N360_PHOPY|nr:uncharacterized protein LOC116168953 isoform X2 [Photinus pyralis]KAB0799013.1 hypothetical protein PPYR_06893 [Photinus pyralis]
MEFFFKLTSQDSVNQAAVSRYLYVIIMTTCIVYSHSNPITTKPRTPWWCQPCQNQHKTRHSRAINEILKDQFNVAIINYQNYVSPYVKQIHKKIGFIKEQFSKHKWLPRKKFYQSLRRDNVKILPELLYQLQTFAVTIERLSSMDIQTQDSTFDAAQRASAMQLVKRDLDALRCDTEDEITAKRQTIVKTVDPHLADGTIPEVVHHLTEGLIQDYSILENYLKFLKKSRARIFGGQKKKANRRKNNSIKPRKKTTKDSAS